MSDFLPELKKRGFFHQCTNEETLSELASTNSVIFYVGFDCTARSLHIGNLMQIMLCRTLQKFGHKPIIIVGGATSKIGDPTGRDDMRKVLSQEDLELNIAGIKKSLSKFLKFGEGKTDAILMNNSNWLEKINYIDFLGNFGKDFSINRMLSMESVKSRLDRQTPMSFLEFNYMLLQAYDFYILSKDYNCSLQLGGSDQWGNIVTGIDLVRRKLSKEVFGITTPLLTTSSGAKMGKSASGAIWINEELLSPYDYFQYWRNCEDADVVRFSKLYAEFDDNEQLEFDMLVQNSINDAKKRLAHKLCEICHGKIEADKALDTSIKLFEQGDISDNLPKISIAKELFEKGIIACELFFITGLTSSKTEARKLIRGGGARINDIQLNDENLQITLNDFNDSGILKISSGKKKHFLVTLS